MSDDPEYTHLVTMKISSNEDSPDIALKVSWSPNLVGADIETLGYYPAAFQFMEKYILPALEAAYLRSEFAELLSSEPPSDSIN